MGRGRAMLGAAEQTFVATVDQSVYIGAFVAIAIAAVAALLLARYLSRPMRQLETLPRTWPAATCRTGSRSPAPPKSRRSATRSTRMADSLEEAEILRRRLVADVAHELRNPIAAASAQAEGMAEGVLTSRHGAAGLSGRGPAAPHRARRRPAGTRCRRSRPAALRDVAGGPHGACCSGGRARDSGCARRRLGDLDRPRFELVVNADERRLSQVLRNLLANALRHTATRHGLGHARAGRHHGPSRCRRHGRRHPAAGPATHLRALLPRGCRASREHRRRRARSGDLAHHRRGPRRRDVCRERPRERRHRGVHSPALYAVASRAPGRHRPLLSRKFG